MGSQDYLIVGQGTVAQDFDFVSETDLTTAYGQVKCPSLSDYDLSEYDEPNNWLNVTLNRWGDRRLKAFA